MTETPAAQLWTPSGFQPDLWPRGEAPVAGQQVLLPLAAWREAFAAAGANERALLGVEMQPGEAIDPLLAELSAIPLVALAFPAFTDGRGYSKAALLRRHGYRGILRATGQVLIDQIPLMLRMGFDEFLVAHEITLARLAGGLPGGPQRHYQPAPLPAGQPSGAFSWRRTSQMGSLS